MVDLDDLGCGTRPIRRYCLPLNGSMRQTDSMPLRNQLEKRLRPFRRGRRRLSSLIDCAERTHGGLRLPGCRKADLGEVPLMAGYRLIASGHDDDISWSGAKRLGGQLSRDFARPRGGDRPVAVDTRKRAKTGRAIPPNFSRRTESNLQAPARLPACSPRRMSWKDPYIT